MARKPIRVFKGQGAISSSQARLRQRVYKDAADADRMSITQEVLEYPEEHIKKRSNTVKSDRYGALLHCIYDAVLITDTTGAIIEVNARAEHIFKYSTEDLKSMQVTDVIAGADSELLDVLHENVSEKRFTLLEAVCVRSDDTRFHAEIVVNQVKITSSDNLCFFMRDITERKEAEAQLNDANDRLLEAERLQSRMDTLATLYHELNNPMQIMMCMAELDSNVEYRKQLSRIMSVLDNLRSEQPLDAIVDEEGVSRYEIDEPEVTDESDPQRILIVDDEDMLRQMFEGTISQSIPYLQIDSVSSAEEAIALYREHHHSLVIMDVAMPQMSGEEAFANIDAISEANKWKTPRCIFCTGIVVSENLHAIIGDGAIHTCLKKPLTMSDLVTAVRTRLAGLPQE
jgi:PAS domain S-box-containing protein